MSDYLEDLGRELDRAAARRVAGSRRPWRFVPAFAAAATALAVAAVVFTAGAESPERPATTEPPVSPRPATDVPPPPPELADVPITVANGTTVAGLAAYYADQLERAGWQVAEIINASQTDLTASAAVGEDAQVVADMLGFEVGGQFDLGGADPDLAIVLGLDVAPRDASISARPGEEVGGACLEFRPPGEGPLSSCGVAPTDAAPLGLVTVATLPSGRWYVYGYATESTASVRVGKDDEIFTSVKDGVPGRFFAVETAAMPSVYVAALSKDGDVLGSVGSLESSEEKPAYIDEARAAGDLPAFTPSMTPEAARAS